MHIKHGSTIAPVTSVIRFGWFMSHAILYAFHLQRMQVRNITAQSPHHWRHWCLVHYIGHTHRARTAESPRQAYQPRHVQVSTEPPRASQRSYSPHIEHHTEHITRLVHRSRHNTPPSRITRAYHPRLQHHAKHINGASYGSTYIVSNQKE